MVLQSRWFSCLEFLPDSIKLATDIERCFSRAGSAAWNSYLTALSLLLTPTDLKIF